MEDGQNNNDAPDEIKVRVGDSAGDDAASEMEGLQTEEDELERLSAEAQDDFGTKDEPEESVPEEEPKIESVVNVENSYAERVHVYKNHGFYAFRYVIMLLSGGAFLYALISILSITISKFVNEKDFYVSPGLGPLYANLATTVIILGLIHLFISMTVGKNWKADDGEKKKYPIVLSVIYSAGIGVSLITTLVLFLGTLFGSMLGLNEAKGTDILEQFLISLVAILILGFALIYKLNLFKHMPKAVYVIIMGAVAAAGVILFLAFPAKEIRDAIYDNNVAKDLDSIEIAARNYYDEKGALPASLEELTFEKDELHYKLKNYKYTVKDSGRSRNRYYSSPEYEICATFRTNTEEEQRKGGYSYSYYYYSDYGTHPSGEKCFPVSLYGYYGPVYNSNSLDSSSSPNYYYDDDDYDYSYDEDEEEEEEDGEMLDWDDLESLFSGDETGDETTEL